MMYTKSTTGYQLVFHYTKNFMHDWSGGHVSVYGTAGAQIMCIVRMKEVKRRNSIIAVDLFILEFGVSSICCDSEFGDVLIDFLHCTI